MASSHVGVALLELLELQAADATAQWTKMDPHTSLFLDHRFKSYSICLYAGHSERRDAMPTMLGKVGQAPPAGTSFRVSLGFAEPGGFDE